MDYMKPFHEPGFARAMWAEPTRRGFATMHRALIRASPEAKFCLWQNFGRLMTMFYVKQISYYWAMTRTKIQSPYNNDNNNNNNNNNDNINNITNNNNNNQ
jgi:hypothetical protein